ncbi:hypothetical protein ACFWF1_43945, partial [Nocardia sp. NPDC060255]
MSEQPHHTGSAVRAACTELLRNGRPVTFTGIAARTGISRSSLYRRPELRELVEQHRDPAGKPSASPGSPVNSTNSASPWKPSPPTSSATTNNSANSTVQTAPADCLPCQGVLRAPISRIIEKQQIDLEVQQRRDPVEHLALEVAVHLVQPVHRPITGIVAGGGQPVDVHITADPVRGSQFRRRRQRPVGDQPEQHPLDPRNVATATTFRLPEPADYGIYAQPPPQIIEHVRAAECSGGHQLQFRPAADTANASAGSSSRDNDPTRRFTASRSSSSARPKVNNTFGVARPFTGSYSLCASYRYATEPDLFRRFTVRTYTTPDHTRITAGKVTENHKTVCLGESADSTSPQPADQHLRTFKISRTPEFCGTRGTRTGGNCRSPTRQPPSPE